MASTYVRKTEDSFQLWTNYGYGWEHEVTEKTRKEARQQAKTYRENVPGVRTRVKSHREPRGFWKN